MGRFVEFPCATCGAPAEDALVVLVELWGDHVKVLTCGLHCGPAAEVVTDTPGLRLVGLVGPDENIEFRGAKSRRVVARG